MNHYDEGRDPISGAGAGQHRRVVSAALAEAIPACVTDDRSVRVFLAEAGHAIVAVGGEPRSVETLSAAPARAGERRRDSWLAGGQRPARATRPARGAGGRTGDLKRPVTSTAAQARRGPAAPLAGQPLPGGGWPTPPPAG
jgi:hypothetical protein